MISVIIPVYNEADYLTIHGDVLFSRICLSDIEVIVVDGSSNDTTNKTLHKFQKLYDFQILQSKKGRAIQMNVGVKQAQGDILFFLFCDCLPEL
jgi:glycosyltransferase involved in cell wall biosynthesis